ncbi:MAG: PA0069 family radical SAM protein [Methylocystis sp.]|jgi:DNA repair photolyase|nr:PA0069 family radical SAM protein [Methylocystis sp.]MCA3584361.1 PA0069 family radical SAM protein [Methylocystis sp.]MCA3589376.1 PA0069 family radical SAM protein [Methylocystis sp.]MCA3592618.1 PA0069 family radical SAM protein [Methylocystis sp.]
MSLGIRQSLDDFRRDFIGSAIDPDLRRGRGSATNRGGRYETYVRMAEDDGWGSMMERPAFKTETMIERAKSIITRNGSPDLSFDRSVNPYRGCEHGCAYCFARPSHAHMGLSPGLDFETRLFAKTNAAELLERELSAADYEPRTIAIGTNTDPYQPIERQHRIMREVLEVLARLNHPVGIVTKSALVTRDIDILAPMAAKGLAKVAISVTTLDRSLCRDLEPRAATPEKRLDTIRQLSSAGIPVTVLNAPIIPGINEAEIEAVLEAAKAAGASDAGYVLLRLPLEVRDIFREWLLDHAPGKLRHVMSLVQSTRGGKDYDSRWGHRQTGTGPYAWMVGRRFQMAADRLGFNRKRLKLRTDLFAKPARSGDQLMLL